MSTSALQSRSCGQLAGQQASLSTHAVMVEVGLPQVPLTHLVFCVQLLPSLHDVPSLAGWPPVHAPALHFSPVVQKFPSSHAPPLLVGVAVHVLAASLQAPTR